MKTPMLKQRDGAAVETAAVEAFRRAFRKWTGVRPADYRREG